MCRLNIWLSPTLKVVYLDFLSSKINVDFVAFVTYNIVSQRHVYHMKLATKPKAKLIIVAIMHLLTDAIGISVILPFADGQYFLRFSDGQIDGVWLIIIYTFCAFGLQPFFGLILDSVKRYTPFLYTSAVIMALQSVYVVFSPLLAAVCLGIGNAMFHVAGGGVAIYTDSKAWNLGVFVAPGAIGLALGMCFYETHHTYIYRGLMLFMILVMLVFRFRDDEYIVRTKKDFEQHRGEHVLPIPFVLLLVAVLIRGFGGSLPQFSFSVDTGWKIGMACAVAFGKFIGGFLTDKIGVNKATLFMLVPSCFMLAFGSGIPALAILGVVLFNTTMPTTLYLTTKVLPAYKNFGFGIVALMLMVGSYTAFAVLTLTEFKWYVFLPVVLVSVACIIISEYQLRRKNDELLS